MTDAPQWQCWTITLPNGEAFTIYVENNYKPEMRLRQLLDIADCEAYMTYLDPPQS
jgi:hypothetical protein